MGVKGVNSNLATGIRTIVILFLVWGIIYFKHSFEQMKTLTYRNYLFLIISGIATGLSWLFYFKAIQTGDLSKIAQIDKLSLVLTMFLGFLIFREAVSNNTFNFRRRLNRYRRNGYPMPCVNI